MYAEAYSKIGPQSVRGSTVADLRLRMPMPVRYIHVAATRVTVWRAVGTSAAVKLSH